MATGPHRHRRSEQHQPLFERQIKPRVITVHQHERTSLEFGDHVVAVPRACPPSGDHIASDIGVGPDQHGHGLNRASLALGSIDHVLGMSLVAHHPAHH